MHKRTLIKNATLVNEGRMFVGSLVIDDDRIDEILEGKDCLPAIPADEIVEAEGCYLLPGVIDTHVHFRDPGLTRKADIESESRAAAAGGVTTYFDMPNTLPQTTTKEALDEKLELASQKSHVNFGLLFGATNENAYLLPKLNTHKIAGVKLFMGASTGNMLVDDSHVIESIFENVRVPLVVHCEDSSIIERNAQEYKEQLACDDPDISYHPLIRSEEACYKSTRQAVQLAKKHGTKLHVAHVSTARELKLFSPDFPNITAEACVSYLLFCDKDYATLGTRIKCNPAIKTEKDRDALRKALTNGKISTVATDHAPHRLADKVGGCLKAASGIPLVQYSLLSMLDLADQGILGITDIARLMCHAPATLFQIENRGYLREGYKADLVLLKPNSYWTLTPNRIESKCGWSPLEGHTFHWTVKQTYCNGFLIYNDFHITDPNFRGQAVTFCRCLKR